jgi:hypothetical protein
MGRLRDRYRLVAAFAIVAAEELAEVGSATYEKD